jgi:hypothetical protein
VLALLASIATMTAAMDRGDVDEAARQGAIAGPVAVEHALASPVRSTVLAGIAAAAIVADRAELLPALAAVAARGDRRVAIPASRAARSIARALADQPLPDDLAIADLDDWRSGWLALANDSDRFVEVRIAALDVAAALARGELGFDLAAVLGDGDPDVRLAAVELVPDPVPAAARMALAAAVAADHDDRVALAAGQASCAELASPDAPSAPALAAIGAAGLARLRALATAPTAPLAAARDVARCLAADTAPESAAAVTAIARRQR